MSALTIATPATVAASASRRAEAKVAAATRWEANDRLRRSLEGRLQGCAPKYAGPIRRQLGEVKRQLRQDRALAGK